MHWAQVGRQLLVEVRNGLGITPYSEVCVVCQVANMRAFLLSRQTNPLQNVALHLKLSPEFCGAPVDLHFRVHEFGNKAAPQISKDD